MLITVSIVEDDAHTRDGLWQLISRDKNFNCLSQHATAEDAIEKIPGFKPDVVLMDINLPGASGIEAVRKLKPLLPQTQFIMSTVYNDNEAIFSALMAGANGYLLKKTAPKDLLAALHEVCAGGTPMTSQIARRIVEAFRKTKTTTTANEQLTTREQEILELLAQGCLYKEIADQLKISYRTVSAHIEHIYEKLHVHSRAQAVAKHLRQT